MTHRLASSAFCFRFPAVSMLTALIGLAGCSETPPVDPTASRTTAAAPSTGAQAAQTTAPPAAGLSIADVWAKRASLSGSQITVRGSVVKVNNDIMGRNWFHLQDGTGSPSDGTNDLTVTTTAEVKVGDVIVVTGTLATGKDFGAGYTYEAILEEAIVKR